LNEKHTYSGEIIKYNNLGQPRWIHGTVNPIINEKGEVTRYVFIESDISKRKESEIRMAEYMEDLEITNKELDKFAYIVSHDLKAPLRAIGNLSCWIEEDMGKDCSPELKQHFNLIKGRVARMELLINGILEYSRVNRRKNPEEVIDVNILIKEITEFITENSALKIHVDDNIPLICADKLKLQQVFSNLISNAIKYNDKDKPWVKISCREEEDLWKFTVEDNGPGIEHQYHERVFVIFQTLQPRDVIESTGVGLAIVKKIIEEQGGKIWIESEKDKGAKFIFTIPKIKIENKESPLVAATMIIKTNKNES
jgi:light-regulated signal transduction histidine kinase (bacteriophytochrome)